MDLRPLLRAHSYLRVQQPPRLLEVDCDDVALVRVMGEMIVAALARGSELADIELRANNVTVDHDDGPAPRGEYVALTILGAGAWTPEVSWTCDADSQVVLVNPDLDAAARLLGVPWAYTRSTGDGGSVTVILRAQRDARVT